VHANTKLIQTLKMELSSTMKENCG
jgi:hypothetical protein